MTDPILTLEAPLLFDAPYGAPDYTRFLERLNDRLKPQGLRMHRSQVPIEGTALFSGRDFHILITPSEAPLPAEDFAAALASPVNEFAPVDFAELVAAHSRHLAVSVGDGPFLKTEEMIELETKLGILEEVKPADLRLKTRVLHLAVLSLLDAVEPQPTVIHWRQSDLLHTPDSFRALPESDFPGPLVFTPEAITRGTDAQKHPLLGFTAKGAEAFCGRKIVLQPAPLDIHRGVELVADLVARHAAGTIDLTSGGEIALSRTVRARVAEEPSGGEHPEGSISVSLLLKAAPSQDEDDEAEPVAELAMAEAEAVPAEVRSESPATSVGGLLKLVSPRPAASAPERPPQSQPEPGPPPPLPPEVAPAPEPATAAPRKALQAAPAAEASAKHRLQAMGLDRVYNPEPAEGMLRHLLIAVAIVLVAPLPGFILLIVTLIRGPLPKLTFVCAILALFNVVLQASSYLSLLT